MMNRKTNLERLRKEHFDLLVIGGGITGVGIALDAATRGLSVALIEMQDFAAGTSSRSTKLIHGGLRYLKQFEFGLVNEVGRERAIVHKLASHLVHPDKMLLPLVKGGKYGYWLTNIGLSVYDLLAGVTNDDRRRMLTKDETAELEPLLRTDILEGGGFYAEYRTDDARLVMAIARTAAEQGAVQANYVQAIDFIPADAQQETDHDGAHAGEWKGAKVRDLVTGDEFDITADAIVNAAGPWVDDVRSMDGKVSGKQLFLTKGVHLVVDRNRLPVKHTVYFDNEDGRMIFAIPRGGVTYIGTTDTPYSGDKVEPEITAEDVDYILGATNRMFPSVNLTVEDVHSSWAGLRPLINEEGKSASQISRRDEIFVSEKGLISIAGGKLTGYRKMAERVVDRVFKQLGRRSPACATDQLVLTGGDYADYRAVQNHCKQLQQNYPKLLPELSDAEYLVHTYGRSADAVCAEIKSTVDPQSALLQAEVRYTVANEMVVSATDFFERRTGRVNFDIASVQKHRMSTMDVLAEALNWNNEQRKAEEAKLDEVLERVTRFKKSSVVSG